MSNETLSKDDLNIIHLEKWLDNPLLKAASRFISRVNGYKENAKDFYFQVLLSQYRCPECGEGLEMTGPSQCSCKNGHIFDPTLEFQKSICCNARLVKKTFHYACSRCRRSVPSRFVFDERVFDKEYFREMMQQSRSRAKQKKEEIKRLLVESRSGTLFLEQVPDLESVPGLLDDLDYFINTYDPGLGAEAFEPKSGFDLEKYRTHILQTLKWAPMLFSQIAPMLEDSKQDRVGRFVALVYMDNDREIALSQEGQDLIIQRIYHETYS